MRKKPQMIFALAAAAVLWAGCSDKADSEDNRQNAIGFSCNTAKSRVTETTTATISSFRVSAVWARNNGTYIDDFMAEQLVKKESGSWVYSPVQYMPTDGSKIDFFAYSPANATISDFAIGGTNHDEVTLTYDVTTDLAAQQDFMVASALEKTSSPIELQFEHALSSVRIEAKCAEQYVYCNVLSLKWVDLPREGVLTGTCSGTPKQMSWSWSLPATPRLANYEFPLYEENGHADNGVEITSNAFTRVTDPNNQLVLIPHNTNESYSGILVTLDYGDDSGGDFKYNKETFIGLSDMVFEMGVKYVLRINIPPISILARGASSAPAVELSIDKDE